MIVDKTEQAAMARYANILITAFNTVIDDATKNEHIDYDHYTEGVNAGRISGLREGLRIVESTLMVLAPADEEDDETEEGQV